MEPEAIEGVLKSLQTYAYGWRCELPANVRFFGKPVLLVVDTRSNPADNLPPAPDQSEVDLVRLILAGPTRVIAEAERHYAKRYAGVPELIRKVHEPKIWISREMLKTNGPGSWAFVAGIPDDPDWGTHIEFQGMEFLGIWSGD